MHLVADTHTHTIASGHAYSSLSEMVRAASDRGLKAIAITDHGPAMPNGAHEFHFQNTRVWPDSLYGVVLLKGAEVNITGVDGALDLSEELLGNLDINVASIHPPTYRAESKRENNTRAVIAAMQHTHIHIIGHPDDSRFSLDYDEVVRAAADTGTLLEVNNNSLRPNSFRVNARDNCRAMLAACEKYDAMVTVASDAHIDMDVGNFVYALEMLTETGFPETLVANASLEKLMNIIRQ